MNQVTIVDYGLGNLHSVESALRSVGASVTISSEPRQIADAERLVLPGVGAFADGRRELTERGLWPALAAYAHAKRPLLGICLGMQLLFSESHEFGVHGGLGLIPGAVRKIVGGSDVKVPHVGWNAIQFDAEGEARPRMFDTVADGSMVYFVHSFAAEVDVKAHRLAWAQYGDQKITAAVQVGSVLGCQFHPEKSGPLGLAMLKRFMEDSSWRSR